MNPREHLRDILAQFSTAPIWAQLLTKVTLLLAVAWVVHLSLARANPRWRTLLWRGTSVGLALVGLWVFGLPALEVPIQTPASVSTAPAPSSQPMFSERDPSVVKPAGPHRAEIAVAVATSATPHQGPIEARPATAPPAKSSGLWLTWPGALLGIWILGMALLVARLAIAYVGLARLLRTSQAAPEELVVEARRIAAALGCRRVVQMQSSGQYAVPFLYGLRRPVLVLPERMCQSAYRGQLPGVLAHELTHVGSWDFGWNAALQMTSTILWFHPLAWRIGSAHRAACDAVCDAVSASYLGDVQAYCRTLAQVALEGAASFPALGLAMARTCDVRRRIAVLQRRVFAAALGRRAVVGAILTGLIASSLFAGMRFAIAEPPPRTSDAAFVALPEPRATENTPKNEPSPSRNRQPVASAVGAEHVSAAALMRAVYDSQAWINSVHSFRIRSEYKITDTEEERRWRDKHPIRGSYALGGKQDSSPFCTKDEWAWDETRILHRSQSHYEGGTKLDQFTTTWDGSLAVEDSESPVGKQYVLGNKAGQFFENYVTRGMQVPWGPPDAYHFWWSPTDVVKHRAEWSIAPEDFELAGQEELNARHCHVVQSRAGHYRMHIGVADGRLYRRTWLIVREGMAGYNYLSLCQKVGGPSIKTVYHWQRWLQGLAPAERHRAFRELQVAEFEFARPCLRETYDDYREVAPGCWMPFRQMCDTYEIESSEAFPSAHSEQIVTEVAVNQPLPKELFHVELVDGVYVATDRRYDPIIRYTYRKNQTEAERVALCDAERKAIAEGQKEIKKREAVIAARVGQVPPPLPESGWLNGGPLSWKQLRGKVVVLHFWDVNCGPCMNEAPFLAGWHEKSVETGVVVIGIHSPTKDLAAVRKKLADLDAKYPVLIDSPATKPGGLGLLHDWFGNSMWPYTVLVDKNGVIAGHGRVWMGDIAEQMRRLSAAD